MDIYLLLGTDLQSGRKHPHFKGFLISVVSDTPKTPLEKVAAAGRSRICRSRVATAPM
jgi:hypothetical protein